jgi:Zinc-finger domain of monoamine-oxidase A repressor R1
MTCRFFFFYLSPIQKGRFEASQAQELVDEHEDEVAVEKMIVGDSSMAQDEPNRLSSPLTSMVESEQEYERLRQSDMEPLHYDTLSDLTSEESQGEDDRPIVLPQRYLRKQLKRYRQSLSKARSAPNLEQSQLQLHNSTSEQQTSASVVLPRTSSSARTESRPSRPSVSSALCHQCRRPNKWVKMTCSNTMESGERCKKNYCAYCVLKRYPLSIFDVCLNLITLIGFRYPEITFDAFSKTWICPWCQDVCNCTVCCTKRGDEYVSTRFEKIDEEALRQVTSGKATRPKLFTSPEHTRHLKKVKKPNLSNKPSADPLTKTASLLEQDGGVRGQYWAAVFSVEGERIGKGFIGESASEIIVQLDEEPGGRKARRLVIGKWHRGSEENHDDEEFQPTLPIEKGKGRATAMGKWHHESEKNHDEEEPQSALPIEKGKGKATNRRSRKRLRTGR